METTFRYAATLLVLAGLGGYFAERAAGAAAVGASEGGPKDAQVAPSVPRMTVMPDFRLGISVSDSCESMPGNMTYTPTVESGGGWSDWACDGNCYDPDTARLDLDVQVHDDVFNMDMRVCLQASDGKYNHTNEGAEQCTDWASVPGGQRRTGPASDDNNYDPDSYRVLLQTRPWPNQSNDQKVDCRFRLRAWDGGVSGNWSTWTGWASTGGGTTDWAADNNCYDPDAFEIEMEIDIDAL